MAPKGLYCIFVFVIGYLSEMSLYPILGKWSVGEEEVIVSNGKPQ